MLSHYVDCHTQHSCVGENPPDTASAPAGPTHCGHCLTADEEEALFKALAESEWVSHIVLFALHAGMRRGEIFNLRWFDVDATRETVHVRQSKSGKARAMPMNETVKALLRRSPKTSEYVFPSPRTGGRVTDVGRQSEPAVRKAEIVNFRSHDLRHTAATRIAAAGVDPFALAYISGGRTFGWRCVTRTRRKRT